MDTIEPKEYDEFGVYKLSLEDIMQDIGEDIYQFDDSKLKIIFSDSTILKKITDVIKNWAIKHNVNYYTHWARPMGRDPATKNTRLFSCEHGKMVCRLNENSLLSAEVDASSFKNGDIAPTHASKGFVYWDPHTPIFIKKDCAGNKILYIPAILGDNDKNIAFDDKFGLRNSKKAVSKAVTNMMAAINHTCNGAKVNLGIEQEFFLLPKKLVDKRIDLKLTGRAIIPDHDATVYSKDDYLSSMPNIVNATLTDAKNELESIGIEIEAIHTEAAPCQFEMVQKYTECNIAVDQNALVMQSIQEAANKNELKAIFHDKPFYGINGSGKHCNWSVETTEGLRLFDNNYQYPGENIPFLISLIAFIVGVFKYAKLLQASVNTQANSHRLGGHEAPPFEIGISLGQKIERMLNNIENYGVNYNPSLDDCINLNDNRNRTAPIIFTGTKFEFRTVGGSQSPGIPITILNTLFSEGLDNITDEIKSKTILSNSSNPEVFKDNQYIYGVLAHIIKNTKSIRYEDNYYKRDEHNNNIVNTISPVYDIAEFINIKSIELLTSDRYYIYSLDELLSKYKIQMLTYKNIICNELNIIHDYILPYIQKIIINSHVLNKQELKMIKLSTLETISKLKTMILDELQNINIENDDNSIKILDKCLEEVEKFLIAKAQKIKSLDNEFISIREILAAYF